MLAMSAALFLAAAISQSPTVDVAEAYARRVTADNDRIRAAAEYQRAAAEAQRILAERLKILAEADLIREQVEREQIKNRIDRIASYHKIRRMNYLNAELRKDEGLESSRKELLRRLAVLLETPLRNKIGDAHLNELLDYLFLADPRAVATTATLPLPADAMRELVVWDGYGSRRARRSLGAEDPYVCTPPKLFRADEELKHDVVEFLAARKRVVVAAAAGKLADDSDFDTAMAALDRLGRRVGELKPDHPWRLINDPAHVDYFAANRFLDEQGRQIGRLAVARRAPKPFEGSSAQELVAFMRDQGMRFAPAQGGGDAAYFATAIALRQLLKSMPPPTQEALAKAPTAMYSDPAFPGKTPDGPASQSPAANVPKPVLDP